MSSVEEEDEAPSGAPAWMATFADLMTLLMTFFVLLLSFSVMDVEKYKAIAGSMKSAFGVQQVLKLEDIPKGTSIIAQEFSPGKTTPTPLDTITQQTQDTTKQSLTVGDAEEVLKEQVEALVAETVADKEKLEEILEKEVSSGKIDIESDNRSIVIRIREQGSFPSGSATLNEDFAPVMEKLRDALVEISGKIAIEGHTDNIPISGNGGFKSNWGLSSSRALSVAHALLEGDYLDDNRMMVVGYSDTQPFTYNDTAEGRSLNRRVEIVIRQGLEDSKVLNLDSVKDNNSPAIDILGLE